MKSKNIQNQHKFVTVFRLETSDGLGIYRNNIKNTSKPSMWDLVTNKFEDPIINPIPYNDLKIDLSYWSEYICGFKDIEQYKNWVFNPYWRRQFANKGVRMVTYTVPEDSIHFGKKQLAFNKNLAIKINDESLLNYL